MCLKFLWLVACKIHVELCISSVDVLMYIIMDCVSCSLWSVCFVWMKRRVDAVWGVGCVMWGIGFMVWGVLLSVIVIIVMSLRNRNHRAP